MDRLGLLERVAGGEDSFTEFKREIGHADAFASELIAFANSGGGQVLLGVDDTGTIVGVDDPRRTEERILNIGRNNCVPPMNLLIEKVDVNGNIVIVVHVPQRLGRPYENTRGQCYIRAGSTKRLASADERARMLEAAGLFHFEETPVPRTSLEDLNEEVFAEYYRRVYDTPLQEADVPLHRVLENMRFVVRDVAGAPRLSVAGLLLFGQSPQDHLFYSRVSAVRWAGLEAGEEITDRQEILGRLPQIIQATESFILRNIRLSTRIVGVRQHDYYQYPRPAIREAIVNAVSHRDYSLSGSQIRIFIFDDRLEVYSPGRLPNGVTLDNIRTHFSKPRNEIIARALLNLGYVNILGSGIPRMIRLMREHSGREPDFELRDELFLVRLWGRTGIEPPDVG
ncbi:MAG: ATP-binding protein [Anaerolineae bacterium]